MLPFVVGGILLAVDDTNGMYWIGFGMIAAVVISMLTTWVSCGRRPRPLAAAA